MTITLIIGDDELKIRRLTKDLTRDRETTTLDASGLDPVTISAACAPQLFPVNRTVIVTSGQNLTNPALKALSELAPTLGADVRVGIISSKNPSRLLAQLKDVSTIEKVDKPKNDRERADFVSREVKDGGRSIDRDGVDALVNLGPSLGVIAGAVQQLLVETSGTITAELVTERFGGRASASGFMVADAAVRGDARTALALLRTALRSGVANVLIASALTGSVRDVVNARAGRNSGPAWKAQKTQAAARRFSNPGLALALKTVAELDALVKGGTLDAHYALERAVIDIARSTRI